MKTIPLLALATTAVSAAKDRGVATTTSSTEA
jgi:hypothetical protein